ncbi:calcipressin [Neohortaea acidophila]|uniref:Calcipressin n=1 Tax=Neohortaea acidophila TaxID=245834 RepID=A0A6A6PGT1_9PEZI|nr:calcipressin [Neohortaea acidophila]KAF2479125.1 calcipressin [Neohortaea acidophila]
MATTTMEICTPPHSSQSSPTSGPRKTRPANMSIDLSDLPPLSEPTPPSNTLLITNLQAPEIFTAANLDFINRAISEHALLHSFSPLKSFRRIICTFYNTDDAIRIRQLLDGEAVLGERIRVYFGVETKVELDEDRHLRAPKSDKLFFISPPPSPPMGWEMRDEEPPNKEVHAEDLAAALANLSARPAPDAALEQPTGRVTRQRSGTGTVVYDPEEHGHSPALPAIAVEDTSESLEPHSEMEGVEKKFVHTSRPPVELMEDA